MAKKYTLKKTLRVTLRIFGWIVGVFLAAWLVIWVYVIFNKKSLVNSVVTEINSKVKGEVKIRDLEPSLLSTFPNVSLRLSDVLVRDSMWNIHHHDLLKAGSVIVRLKLFSLFAGSPEISKVIIENGSAYIFSDTTGYTNKYMFTSSQKTGSKPTGSRALSIPGLELKNVRLVLEQQELSKFYDIDVKRLVCKVKSRQNFFEFDVRTDMLVHSLGFNLEKGAFLKEKTLEGKFGLALDRVSKTLNFKNIRLQIDDHPFVFTGMFDFKNQPLLYFLSIKTTNVNFKRAAALLSNNISSKLDSFNIEKPISVIAVIDGRRIPNKIPLVNIDVSVKDNTIVMPLGVVTDASFRAVFNNQLLASERPVDKNSGFLFTGFTGKWEGIAIRSDSVKISNLEHPVLDVDLHSSFRMKDVNDLLGAGSIEFTKGTCQADVKYHGLVVEGDTAGASIFGTISFSDAAISYLPRNLSLSNCSGKIVFDDKDVFVRQLKAQTANSQLLMNGGIKNLTSLIDKNPEKLILDWKINSPKLNLADFLSFLNKRSATASRQSSKRKFLKLARQIDKTLQDCNVELQINADRLIYKKFEATGVAANLRLTDKVVSLNDVKVQHAGGSLYLNGSLQEADATNMVKLTTRMENVDVRKVFGAFDNFGQDGITDKNLRGQLSANINISGLISTKAEIEPNSMKGTIDFQLKNGELIDFEPVKKISETAFKKRDFSNIRFAELKQRLDVNGSEIKVNRMEIQSTVFTMFVEGIYDVKKGTDLSIQIPLSNLAKRDSSFELKNRGIRSKTGVSLRLRAKTGEDGTAKISWDPFKRALNGGPVTLTDSTGIFDKRTNRKKRRNNSGDKDR